MNIAALASYFIPHGYSFHKSLRSHHWPLSPPFASIASLATLNTKCVDCVVGHSLHRSHRWPLSPLITSIASLATLNTKCVDRIIGQPFHQSCCHWMTLLQDKRLWPKEYALAFHEFNAYGSSHLFRSHRVERFFDSGYPIDSLQSCLTTNISIFGTFFF